MLALPFPNIDPIALQVGPLAIRWYGISYAVALILSWFYVRQLLTRPNLWSPNRPPLTADDIEYLIAYIAAGVIVGGRLGHVLFYETTYYLTNPLKIFAVWEGGMSFHGGVIGTAIAIALFARRFKAPLWTISDLVCASVPIGILLVRTANFVNGEVVGHETSVPWAFVFPNWGDVPRHPAMLYEAALEGALLFIVLYELIHRHFVLRQPGLVTAYFLIGYSLARIFCEFFKLVDFRLIFPPLPLTPGMVLSLPMLILGIWLLAKVKRERAAGPQSSGA
ncbi:MAG: Prolipoprotein diacylglyceryl transferase [Pseudomonadota bacterium]|jgi:phosphatidylglycerol:prolipoprotein diacylglycerol transferase